MIDNDRKIKIWNELIQEAQAQKWERREGEFTRREFAEFTGMGLDETKNFLENKVKDGRLKIRKTSRVYYYSIVE
jgi:hypothetical protein